MRESFGGAFMIKLALIFIILYISFMALAISYTKAFRLKNQIINILEQYQYNGESDVVGKVDEYLEDFSYNFSNNDNVSANCYDHDDAIFTERGACIVPQGEGNKRYYKVITYISIDFPFFDVPLILPISGETKTIMT